MKVVNRMKVPRANSGLDPLEAEKTGVAAFGFLAAEPEYFSRFASTTGISLTDVAEAAGTPEFLSGVLEYLLGDESLLLSFCENNGFEPEFIRRAQMVLGKNADQY